MEKQSTKERYLITALRLFAEKGYDAVSVAQIAAAVGLTPPALYRHFSGKQALFYAIIALSNQDFPSRMGKLGIGFTHDPEERAAFSRMSEDEQVRLIQQLFLHTLEDEYPALFRKMMTVEQFRQPQMAEIYNRRYVDAQYEAFTALMQDGIDRGDYLAGNARTMAVQYISPVIVMVGVCDRAPERKDEALTLIADHVRQFDHIYRSRRREIGIC
jgi:AcrR family transcriptional regulator